MVLYSELESSFYPNFEPDLGPGEVQRKERSYWCLTMRWLDPSQARARENASRIFRLIQCANKFSVVGRANENR